MSSIIEKLNIFNFEDRNVVFETFHYENFQSKLRFSFRNDNTLLLLL
jgi:hypothetical protein